MLQQEDLLIQKLELVLEMNGKKTLAEFAKLREELAQLRDEIGSLKKQRAQEPRPEPQQYVQQASQPHYPQQYPSPYGQQEQSFSRGAPEPPQGWQPRGGGQPTQQYAEPSAPATRPIDRNGVAPSEVSIEKFFYYGNKKK